MLRQLELYHVYRQYALPKTLVAVLTQAPSRRNISTILEAIYQQLSALGIRRSEFESMEFVY